MRFFVGVQPSGVVGCCCFLLALSLLELLAVAVFFVGGKSAGVIGRCCFLLALSLLELLAVAVFCWR